MLFVILGRLLSVITSLLFIVTRACANTC